MKPAQTSSSLLRPAILAALLAGLSSFALMAQTPSIVTIDADKIFILNGRKVFPITMSPGPPNNARTPNGDDALDELRNAGTLMFRISQTTDWNAQVIADQQAALDWAAQHGMYCMVNLRELSEFAATDTTTPTALRNLVNQFKNHPALGVWKNKDEAWWGDVSAADLQRGYDVIKQEDTNHPIEQTHAPRGTLADLQPYNSAADILAIDIYPVGVPPGTHSLLPNKEISMVGDWTQFLSQVANGQKHYWMIEQIAWSGVIPPAHTLVFPTYRQSRYMAYQAIINGARGLMFFGGNVAATLNTQDAPLGWNWTFWDEVLEPVVQQLGDRSALAAALVTTNSNLPITITGTTAPDLEFCAREVPPYLYILASKREGATVGVTFHGLPAWASTGEVLYEPARTVTASNGQFSDTFTPFDVHVYRFAQSNLAPAILFPPQSRANNPGMNVTFTVTADGTGPLTYQWRKNGTNLSNGGNVAGATSPTLSLAGISAADAASYDVVVTGFGSVTSSPPATLSIVPYASAQVPTITSQPQSRTEYLGATTTFTVGVGGNGPFAYRWRKNGSALSNGGNISGATSWRLTLSNVSDSDAADYDVVVTGFSSVTSAPAATLSVIIPTNHLILYEPFNYGNAGSPVGSNTPANWAYNGTLPNDLNVATGNLSWPGLARSIGNSVTNGGPGLGVRRLFGSNVTSGVLYFSALFRINALGYGTWNGAAAQVCALTANDNNSFRLAVMVRSNSPSGFVLGVQKGGTGVTATFDNSTEYHAGDTLFLVGKYDFTTTPDLVSLWVNPGASTFGAASEPATGSISASTGTDGTPPIDRFNIRQNTAASVPAAMQWDELRIGTTWADVTPSAVPALFDCTLLADGALRFAYTNNNGRNYSVAASTNLTDWTPTGSPIQISPGLYQFTDPNATNYPQRFYRLQSP